jgi:hypothetical protein
VSARPRRGAPNRLVVAVVVVVTASVPLSACKEVAEESSSDGYTPAKLEAVKGNDDVQLVTFTAEGARRVGLQMAPVRRSGTRPVVPYAALIYDAEGKTFVYRRTRGLSFLREQVSVTRIDPPQVFLSRGPAPGTSVVTVGAAEVYGTELDIAAG